MREQLANELVTLLMPHISNISAQDLKLRMLMILNKYDVSIAETALIEYQGDMNEIILKRFLAAKIARGLSKRTVKYYKESITMSLQKIGKQYDEITADDLRLYLAQRIYKDGVTKRTANNERRNLSAFYTWLQKEEILLRNPMSKVDAIKEEKVKKKAYEPLEIEKIRVACRTNRERAIIECLASTWCRVSELAQIQVQDIKDGKLTVHGKGAKDREVYLNARAIVALSNYMAERNDTNPYLFPRYKYAGNAIKCGGRRNGMYWYTDPELVDETRPMDMGSIESIVRSIGKRAGVNNVHPHRFRRTGATMALRQGMPLTTVSKLLGHESIETTQIYLDISDEELEQAHKRYVI